MAVSYLMLPPNNNTISQNTQTIFCGNVKPTLVGTKTCITLHVKWFCPHFNPMYRINALHMCNLILRVTDFTYFYWRNNRKYSKVITTRGGSPRCAATLREKCKAYDSTSFALILHLLIDLENTSCFLCNSWIGFYYLTFQIDIFNDILFVLAKRCCHEKRH